MLFGEDGSMGCASYSNSLSSMQTGVKALKSTLLAESAGCSASRLSAYQPGIPVMATSDRFAGLGDLNGHVCSRPA